MHRIDSINSQNGQWVAGNPQTGQRPTIATAAWFNAVQEEISHVIEVAGIELDKTQNNQLLFAIAALIMRYVDPLIEDLRAEIDGLGGVIGGGTGGVTCEQLRYLLQNGRVDPDTGFLMIECVPPPATSVGLDPDTQILTLDIAGGASFNNGLLTLIDTATESYLYTPPELEIITNG